MINPKISGSNNNISKSYQSSNTSFVQNNTSSNNSTIGLEKGQIIQGEVTDLRNQDISVKLEDGRVLTGKLEDVNNLSIGDRVTFKVEDVSAKNLTLKIVSTETSVTKDTTIEKALELAGLSKNTRNQSIVNELLNQQMPIDKNTVTQLIRQSLLFKDYQISTLVSMNKFHIPMTEANISQYESYKNMEHNMMNTMNGLVDNIPKLFDYNQNTTLNEYMKQSNDLLSLILNNSSNMDSNVSENTITPSSINQSAAILNSEHSPFLATGSILSNEVRIELSDMLDQIRSFNDSFQSEMIAKIRDGTATIIDVSNALQKLFQNKNELSPTRLNQITQLEDTAAVQTILKANWDLSNASSDISSILSKSDRMNLLSLLESYSLPDNMKEQIANGTITSNEILKWINSNLTTVKGDATHSLFSSKEFQSLIQDELVSKWTFTPDSLQKEGEINRYFENLYHKLTEIKGVAESQINNTYSNTISNQTGHIQDNINFMNTLNSLFTYIQLPLKLQNQNTNGELYVYKKKKEHRNSHEGISVLLHLDMDYLGPIDIHLELQNKNIKGKFYLKDNDSLNLISSNMNQLEQILREKGYFLTSEFMNHEKEVNIIEEFLTQDTATTTISRYNFDLRA